MIKQLIFVAISLYMAFTFTMAGANKLFPLDPATHAYIVDSSKFWGDVFAPLFRFLPFTPSADGLRIFLGVSEILGAAALVLSAFGIGRGLGKLATFGLISIMAGAVYLHQAFNTSVFTPASLLFLLVVRLLLTPSGKVAAVAKAAAPAGKVKKN